MFNGRQPCAATFDYDFWTGSKRYYFSNYIAWNSKLLIYDLLCFLSRVIVTVYLSTVIIVANQARQTLKLCKSSRLAGVCPRINDRSVFRRIVILKIRTQTHICQTSFFFLIYLESQVKTRTFRRPKCHWEANPSFVPITTLTFFDNILPPE